jgi:hypothetical protein
LVIPEPILKFIVYRMDNNAVKLSRNPKFHTRTKRIEVRYHFLRERVVEVKDLITERVDTSDNVANLLTKALGPKKSGDFITRMELLT